MSSFAYVWNEYTRYLRRPNPEISFFADATTPARRFFVSLILAFMLVVPIVALFGIMEKLGLFPDSDEHAIKELMDNYPFPLVFLGAAVAGPVFEEVAFRLALVPKKVYLIVSLWLASSYYLGFLFQHNNQAAAYILLGMLALATALMLALPRQWNYRFQLLYSLHYGYVFYGFTLLFAAAHLFNFDLSVRVALVAPVLILPQFVLGTLLGYLRMRQGMAWAVALHVTYNSILMGAAYFGMQAQELSPQV